MMELSGLDRGVRVRAEWAMAVARANHIPVWTTSTLRSWAEQTKLRAQWESCLARGEEVYPGNPDSRCRYPANEPGDSAHNFGWAWDSVVAPEHQAAWNYIRQLAGLSVPNPEHDPIHAEVPNWRTYRPTLTRRG